jgi:predicted nucleic acid-binding protein
MEVAHLTSQMFALPYTFATPDILFYEELEEDHPNLLDTSLKILPLTSDTIEYTKSIVLKYPKASKNDLFALALAKQERCPLLTGDGALRKAGKQEEIQILGTIWIIDELIKHDIITKDEAMEAYDTMKDNKRRLPWELIEL